MHSLALSKHANIVKFSIVAQSTEKLVSTVNEQEITNARATEEKTGNEFSQTLRENGHHCDLCIWLVNCYSKYKQLWWERSPPNIAYSGMSHRKGMSVPLICSC